MAYFEDRDFFYDDWLADAARDECLDLDMFEGSIYSGDSERWPGAGREFSPFYDDFGISEEKLKQLAVDRARQGWANPLLNPKAQKDSKLIVIIV